MIPSNSFYVKQSFHLLVHFFQSSSGLLQNFRIQSSMHKEYSFANCSGQKPGANIFSYDTIQRPIFLATLFTTIVTIIVIFRSVNITKVLLKVHELVIANDVYHLA